MKSQKPTIPEEIEFDLGLDEADDPISMRARAAKMLRVPSEMLPHVAVRKRSIDA